MSARQVLMLFLTRVKVPCSHSNMATRLSRSVVSCDITGHSLHEEQPVLFNSSANKAVGDRSFALCHHIYRQNIAPVYCLVYLTISSESSFTQMNVHVSGIADSAFCFSGLSGTHQFQSHLMLIHAFSVQIIVVYLL